ncbi:MAG: RNA polymerase sigma factor [Pirellulaceae bacterium]
MGAVSRTFSVSAAGDLGAAARSEPAAAPRAAAVSRKPTYIERLTNGDRQAFDGLLQEHQAAVYGYLLARLAAPTDAEDLCQEVFLRCYQGCAKLDQTISLRAWLLGIARNVLREHIRRVQRRREVAWTELCLELDAVVQQEHTAGDEALDHLPVCIDSLGRSAREALEMRYHARLKLDEIGRLLHRSEGAIKLLMYRARQALKNCLDRKLRAAS